MILFYKNCLAYIYENESKLFCDIYDGIVKFIGSKQSSEKKLKDLKQHLSQDTLIFGHIERNIERDTLKETQLKNESKIL
ncbi:hypothetical protein BpHYR1_004044 [Brachionus plicatilis]|uniref:Uncharacterized protein n=1 Tax=Brachionus plicatilis TaxID=10195 RepID=A0A3M7RSQ8_BRAPC|nr:hypothetical protein BpHYR1_004044 [Brachionus plicatilis]